MPTKPRLNQNHSTTHQWRNYVWKSTAAIDKSAWVRRSSVNMSLRKIGEEVSLLQRTIPWRPASVYWILFRFFFKWDSLLMSVLVDHMTHLQTVTGEPLRSGCAVSSFFSLLPLAAALAFRKTFYFYFRVTGRGLITFILPPRGQPHTHTYTPCKVFIKPLAQ